MPEKISKHCTFFAIWITILLGLSPFAAAKELPRPGYDNSFVFSIGYYLPTAPAAEIDYIKSQFGGGMYAPLSFSSFLGVNMGWRNNPTSADNSIRSFKNTVDKLVKNARAQDVGIHIILTFGLSRDSVFYHDAWTEDIRNAQWYNDNNMASRLQLEAGSASQRKTGTFSPNELLTHHTAGYNNDSAAAWGMNKFVYTTFSRYARKLRKHLEAKVQAVAGYLTQARDANPDLLIIVSAPGEAELNANRINQNPALQYLFCDYSPFALLEFRDWIRHQGMYGPGGAYDGQGYINGGSRYQGARGLDHFNADFGTSFSTWELKYYHWSLSDPVDIDYTDAVNPDGSAIPFSAFTFDGMMPTSGAGYISGGFDPPRVMKKNGVDTFYDLWHKFREMMVFHYVKDMAKLFRQSGFPKDRYFSHQIPSDYLWGTRPGNAQIPYLNPRYYASASPLWTADVYDDIGIGVTMYDINFGSHYSRTTQYAVPAIAAMSGNWGVMEYNPEITTSNDPDGIGTVNTIYNSMLEVYNNGAHMVNFFKWEGPVSLKFKGNNREYAVKKFFDAVKDKARQPSSAMLTPPIVSGFSAAYNGRTVTLGWGQKIWPDLDYHWRDWGDFEQFVIYRGVSSGFHINSSLEIGRTRAISFEDTGFPTSGTLYYKIVAVNEKDQRGPIATARVTVSGSGGQPELAISRKSLNFGAVTVSGIPVTTPDQEIAIDNTGSGNMSWSAAVTSGGDWLQCSPGSGVNAGVLKVGIKPSTKPTGTYSGVVTISTANSDGSPKNISVTLKVHNGDKDAAPFGTFESPLDNSTVRSSIPVTGWAVDDIAVESVKIYRLSGSNMVYIGDATFVEGARPDVEAKYDSYPNNYRAGWGYMLLTNHLPNNGNGAQVLYAIAADNSGHKVLLGSKTIICDNANAIQPFGAIDTPDQGGSASGDQYINWGWVLTPQPDKILGSSSISVYVDGIEVGHPVYGNYREDIATKFSGYANSNGAVGYFYLDTTQYKNGLHTIEWRATDSSGDSDGVGSRFFNIQNTGSSRQKEIKTSAAAWVNRLDSMPFDHSSPVEIVKGYKKEKKRDRLQIKIQNNVETVFIKELQRVELQLDQAIAGFLVVGDGLRELPIGSTFDPNSGRFCWTTGPGHLGRYKLLFIVRDDMGHTRKKIVNVTIRAKFSR